MAIDKIPTHELTNLRKYFRRMQGKDLTGSAVRLCVYDLSGAAVGDMDFIGEHLPDLLPILLKSIDETLSMRAALARADLNLIKGALEA